MPQPCTCPHCGATMDPMETPWDSSWGGEIHYVCFNDQCVYFTKSWDMMEAQGVEDTGYRCRRDPRGEFAPIAVWSMDALKDRIIEGFDVQRGTTDLFDPADFVPHDRTPDAEFYGTRELEFHLDSLALSSVEELYAGILPKKARILDLAAGADSHLRQELEPLSVIGLGLSPAELDRNPVLTKRVIHDLNADGPLPFQDASFDAVVCCISVEYLTRPIEVFRETARVLKRNGLFVVVFSNRMFPAKAVPIWKKTNEAARVDLVRKYFTLSERFYLSGSLDSTGKPRPVNDKYYPLGLPSDPVYAVWGNTL
ncbi:MAG: methyltransferase domain-containing protein [Thermodesulfobacteriota bacterium]